MYRFRCRNRSPHRYVRVPVLFRRRTWLVLALSAGVLTACQDEPSPVAPDDEETVELPPADPPTTSATGASIFIDQAHPLLPQDYELLSSGDEIAAGRYRIRARDGAPTSFLRDDFIIAEGPDGEPHIRRVLESQVDGIEVVMETGRAYWHEVLRGGRYAVTVPMDGSDAVAEFPVEDGGASGPAAVAGSFTAAGLPALEASLSDQDVCAWIEDALAALPGNTEREACGSEKDFSVSILTLKGTLDTLRINRGAIRLEGTLHLLMDLDEGGISGGSPPVFSPCDEGAYLGCLTTPTGAALIDFLRTYAPGIRDGSLPPVRVCVPGHPVRVEAAQFFPWRPPVYETCGVTDFGTLPTITYPSVQRVEVAMAPDMSGLLQMRMKGDATVQLQIPIPTLAYQAVLPFSRFFEAKFKVGIFVLLSGTFKNFGGTAQFTVDVSGETDTAFDPVNGWGGDFTNTGGGVKFEFLELNEPDSMVFRFGVPVEAELNLCLGVCDSTLTSGSGDLRASNEILVDGEVGEGGGTVVRRSSAMEWWDPAPKGSYELPVAAANPDSAVGKWILEKLNVGTEAKLGFTAFYEVTHTRPVLNADPFIDNHHISLDYAWEVTARQELKIPGTDWILPDVPRGYGDTWECCRVPVSDYWFQGNLDVAAVTTGVDLDPDGYQVTIQRADSVERILDDGARRIGSYQPRPRSLDLGVNTDVRFGFDGVRFVPCFGLYTDALVLANPLFGATLAGARAVGLDFPNWGVTSPCPLLVAPYTVTLGGVAENCVVVGGPRKDSVWIRQLDLRGGIEAPTRVQFDVQCDGVGPNGSLEVVLPPRTVVEDEPPVLLMDGVFQGAFPENDTLVLTRLAPTLRTLGVAGLELPCISSSVEATVVVDATTTVELPLVCDVPPAPDGGIQYLTSLEGGGTDPNGYALAADGVQVAAMDPLGYGLLENVEANTVVAMHVVDIAPNCQPLALNPRTVTMDGARTPQTVAFPVRCIDAPVDTLTGTLDAQGWPTPAVTLRSPAGTTRTLRGPKVEELLRLSGTPVEVWGQMGPTDFEVHGYTLQSVLGDDRWLGILLDRPDGLWLYGEEAIRILNAPGALSAASGNLVWVAGVRENTGIRVSLFGSIRGGGS